MCGWWIASVLAYAFICSPVSSNWDPTVPAQCGNQRLLAYIDPLPWIVTDFAILVAPLPVLARLHAPRRQKVGIIGLFLIGGVTCIVSCVRYSTLPWPATDVTWTIVPLTIYNTVEVYTSIICACLLATRPLFLKLFPDKLIDRIQRSWSQYCLPKLGRSKSHPLGIMRKSPQRSPLSKTLPPLPNDRFLIRSERTKASRAFETNVQKPSEVYFEPFSMGSLEPQKPTQDRYEIYSSQVGRV